MTDRPSCTLSCSTVVAVYAVICLLRAHCFSVVIRSVKVADDGSDGEMWGEESVRYLSPEEMELEMNYSTNSPTPKAFHSGNFRQVGLSITFFTYEQLSTYGDHFRLFLKIFHEFHRIIKKPVWKSAISTSSESNFLKSTSCSKVSAFQFLEKPLSCP